ncbi:MAG: histone deacetylase [Spirochaetales bacterium]|nr:histone deacetylase [Spirochaetales bacterium]
MAKSIAFVYSPEYTIELGGIERYHPFDTSKYQTVRDDLIASGAARAEDFVAPAEATVDDLLLAHTRAYLNSLADPLTTARIAEVNEVAYFPAAMIDKGLYRPMRFAAGGTILGARLALERGAAVNLSGGFHHAKRDSGGGFCYYSDIAIAIERAWRDRPDLKVLVVDLDAHQGNGYESIFADDRRIGVFDVYNRDIFPEDKPAEKFIDFPHPIRSGTDTAAYLALVARELPPVLDSFRPGLVVYIAGTDVFEADPLGKLAMSADGIVRRDEFVFREARVRGVPFLMLLGGGYTTDSGPIIARSLENLLRVDMRPAP